MKIIIIAILIRLSVTRRNTKKLLIKQVVDVEFIYQEKRMN